MDLTPSIHITPFPIIQPTYSVTSNNITKIDVLIVTFAGSGRSVIPVTTELTCDAIKKCYKAAKKCFKTVKSVIKCYALLPTLTPPLTVGTVGPVVWVCGKAFYSVYKYALVWHEHFYTVSNCLLPKGLFNI